MIDCPFCRHAYDGRCPHHQGRPGSGPSPSAPAAPVASIPAAPAPVEIPAAVAEAMAVEAGVIRPKRRRG